MRLAVTVLSLAASFVVGLAGPAAGHEPEHLATGSPATPALNHGHKWPTDAPLRRGMAAIRGALVARLPAIDAGTLSASEYRVLGARIDAQLTTIIAECTLAPAADANLHLILADLIVAAHAMQDPARAAAGAQDAVRAADRYGEYFDDEGWRALR
jgi:hypothetical protein